jgi:hypothetical protein
MLAIKAFTPEVSSNNMKLMNEAYKIGQLL